MALGNTVRAGAALMGGYEGTGRNYRGELTYGVLDHQTPVDPQADPASMMSKFIADAGTRAPILKTLIGNGQVPVADMVAAEKSGNFTAIADVERQMVDQARLDWAEHHKDGPKVGPKARGMTPGMPG